MAGRCFTRKQSTRSKELKRILFLETTEFTGATRVTRTLAKKCNSRFDVSSAIITNLTEPKDEIRKVIEKVKPQIVFCSFSAMNPDVIEVGKEKQLSVIVRNDYNLRDLTIENKKRIKETYSKADFIIVQTPEMKKELLREDALQDCRIKVVENPLDEEDILQKAAEQNPFMGNGCYHFLWVGRKDPIKDLPTLERAFELVHERFPKTDLALVMEDPNPYRWIKYADCLVISSISEASPNVLREALFLGTDVVSTDCSPTVKRLLSHDRIAEVGNAAALARVMILRIVNRDINNSKINKNARN